MEFSSNANIPERTVADWVTYDFRTATVFKKYGIDFCCGGRKLLDQVCKEKGVDRISVEADLRQALESPLREDFEKFKTWSVTQLANYIESVHHPYVKQNLPIIREFAQKVAKVHGHANPETIRIAELWEELSDELKGHLFKEENILFPYIREIEKTSETVRGEFSSRFGSIQNPISVMELEHEDAGRILEEIRALSHQFTPPSHACNTYKVLYFKLSEFQDDLHQHVHLENNLLFPHAAEIERALVGN